MMKWSFVAIVATAGLFFNSTALAQQGTTPAKPTADDRGSDKLDLKKLEDKYWSAKDSDFSVVQNRTYTKDNRFFFSLAYGPMMNDAYSTGRNTAFSAGYYFSERWGLEVSHEAGDLKQNTSTEAFIKENAFAPNYNTFESATSLNLIFVPLYAKMSFLDKKILYFDMQFSVGVGTMQYEIQKASGNTPATLVENNEKKSALVYNFDVTQQIFFHKNFAIRFDIKNKFSTQKKERYFLNAGEPESARDLGNTSAQDTSMLLGLNIFW